MELPWLMTTWVAGIWAPTTNVPPSFAAGPQPFLYHLHLLPSITLSCFRDFQASVAILSLNSPAAPYQP